MFIPLLEICAVKIQTNHSTRIKRHTSENMVQIIKISHFN